MAGGYAACPAANQCASPVRPVPISMTRLESRKSSRGEPAVTIPASRHKITYIATDQLLIASTRGCGQFSCKCVESLIEFDEISRKDVQQGPAVFFRHSLLQNEAVMDLLGSVCELGVIPLDTGIDDFVSGDEHGLHFLPKQVLQLGS